MVVITQILGHNGVLIQSIKIFVLCSRKGTLMLIGLVNKGRNSDKDFFSFFVRKRGVSVEIADSTTGLTVVKKLGHDDR